MKIGQDGDIKIFAIELTVTYSIYKQLVEIKHSSYEHSCPTFSILDKEVDKETQGVTIEVAALNEITLLIKDFESKFNKLIQMK